MTSITNVNVLLQQFVITKYMLGKCKLKLYKLNLVLQDLEKNNAGLVTGIKLVEEKKDDEGNENVNGSA